MKYRWQARIQETDDLVRDKVKEELLKDVMNDKKQYRLIIAECIENFKQRFKDGLINVRNPEELIKLINLDLQLVGERIGQDEIRVTIERAK